MARSLITHEYSGYMAAFHGAVLAAMFHACLLKYQLIFELMEGDYEITLYDAYERNTVDIEPKVQAWLISFINLVIII